MHLCEIQAYVLSSKAYEFVFHISLRSINRDETLPEFYK